MKKAIVVLLLGGLLGAAGCTTIERATEDRTSLAGDVPERLGRILEVAVEGEGDATVHDELRQAIQTEFESRDLFDHVIAAVDSGAVPGRRTSRLHVQVERISEDELFDLIEFQNGFIVRYELQVELYDTGGTLALEGHVSGIGEDTVTDDDELTDEVRGDVRLTAMHDAGMKISRGLRLTADARAREAFEALPHLTLPPGVGPLDIAVLGFDDDSGRRRGVVMAGQVARALQAQGPELRPTRPEDVLRAMDPLPRMAFMELGAPELQRVARTLPARVFVVGQLEFTGDQCRAVAKVFDRRGELLQTHEASAVGLGALRVLAARLGQAIGAKLAEEPPDLGDPAAPN